MKVGVIGGGAIGLLISSYIGEAMECTIFVKRQQQMNLLKENGLKKLHKDGISTTNIDVTMNPMELKQQELLIVAVKYKDIVSALQLLQEIQYVKPVLFIQNGIGHVKLIEQAGIINVYYGTIEHGALRINDYTVQHNGIGNFVIEEKEECSAVRELIAISSEKFPIVLTKDADQMLFRKVIINCLINPLTAIMKVQNGNLVHNKNLKELVSKLYDELVLAFPNIPRYLRKEDVYDVCGRTAENHSSMLADRLAGRQMEVETIVTAVIEKASHLSRSLPILETYEGLLKAMNDLEGVKK